VRKLFAILLLFCGGCASSYVQLPKTPTWVAPADPTPMSAFQAKLTTQILLPNAVVSTSDASYIRVNHAWALAMLDWSTDAAKMLGFTYTANSRNCTKFSMALYIAMTDSAARAGVDLSPLIARLTVQQDNEFAGVPASPGSRHSLLGLATDKSPYLWVMEPQPSGRPRLIPLQEYPNKILSVVLGDFNP
jgi:hypothetical protein